MKEYKYTIDGNRYEVAINEVNENTAKVTVNGAEYTVEWEKPVEEKPIVKVQPIAAKPAPAVTPAAPASPATNVKGNAIKTPLPGVIIDIKVKAGDTVKKGDTVVVLEAMKMENNIDAERDGKITESKVNKGDSVMEGAILVTIE